MQAGTEDLSGQLFTEVFGDGSAYQVTDVTLSEDLGYADVTYIAETDSVLTLSVFKEQNWKNVAVVEMPVPAGSQTVRVALDMRLPAHFWVEAVLSVDGAVCSEVFYNSDHTEEYEEFLQLTAADYADAENVILDYEEDAGADDNFAVVSEDVKVVRVESMEDVDVVGGEETAGLFGLMESTEGYVLKDVVNEEVLEELSAGDKLLILPGDDVNDARIMQVGDVEEVAVLFDNGEMGTAVEVTAGSEEAQLEDFFEVIKLDVTVEADTEDVDTDQRDDDVMLVDEPVVDESAEDDLAAELFDSKSASKKSSASFTVKVSSKGVTVTDTVSLTAKITLSIDYKTTLKIPSKLNKITAKTELTAKNVFNIHSDKAMEYKPSPKKIGTIPIGTVAGVTFTVPVYLTFSATFKAEFDFTATQTVSTTVTITYKSGSYSSKTSNSASSTKEIVTEAKVVVKLGIKATVKASFLKVIEISFSAEVGLQATGTLQSVNSTSTYKHTNVVACLTVDLDLYVTPSFDLSLCDKSLAKKTWKTTTKRLLTFYAHLGTNLKWSYGTGDCPYRQYLVTLNVKDNSKKALSGVTVKEGSKTLGTVKNGKISLWLSMGSHVLKLSLKNYTTATASFKVSSATSKDVVLYKSGANEVYYTMENLTILSDEEYAEFMADAELVANTIFEIQTAEDLQALSAFTARTDRTTEGLRFVLNNEDAAIDLTEVQWTPIGSGEQPFLGELDGNGFTVTGLAVDTDADYAGLFGSVEGALIHDITLSDASVTGGSYAGVLAGKAAVGSVIYDIAVTGGSVSGSDCTGGIVGAMEQTDLLNSFSTAAVSGAADVGGITGSFAYTDTKGQITNCYAAGELAAESNSGGVCGTVTYTVTLEEEPVEEETFSVGIQYAYYLDTMADSAVAGAADAIAYAVTVEQADGTNAETMIAEDGSHANALTLLDALNSWYMENGVYSENEAASDSDSEVETEGETVPEGNANDYYNRWYADGADADGAYSNGGYPVFGQKGTLYVLTVYYVYENGEEAKDPVTLYLAEGQSYDVDTPAIPGYHTNEEEAEYAGVMPDTDLEYLVIYVKDDPCDATMASLAQSGADAETGKSYSIATEAELVQLANYVNAGKNTVGVTFRQIAPIELSADTAFASIGTAEYAFAGTFDGDYQGLSNLPCGLFGFVGGAEIKAVVAKAAIAAVEGRTVGVIADVAESSVLESSVVIAEISGSGIVVGGLVGAATNTVIEQCSVDGSVAGSYEVGGLVGRMTNGTMTNSNSTVQVSGGEVVGGLVGAMELAAVIRNCYTTGAVSGSAKVGGLVGSAAGTVENVYQSGTVSGGDGVFGEATDVKADSLWYQSGNTSAASGAEVFELTADGVAALRDGLNAWLLLKNDTAYLTWTEESVSAEEAQLASGDAATPVFGMAYTTWLSDLTVADGVLSYSFDNTYCADGVVYVALYTAGGQMIDLIEVMDSTANVDVSAAAAYATAFVMTEEGVPMSMSVTSK